MGILGRFADIMSANINAMLDSWEDPAKMIDQTLRELNENLAEVKKETAAIMAEETAAKRRVEEINEEIRKYYEAATKAIQQGNDGDATKLLAKKQEYEHQLVTAQTTYAAAKANSDKMQQMYNKLVNDINTLNSRRANVKAQLSMAQAQERINGMSASMQATGAMDKFARMEEKAQKQFDMAMANAELSGIGSPVDEATELATKYATGTNASVQDELTQMKIKMGLIPDPNAGVGTGTV